MSYVDRLKAERDNLERRLAEIKELISEYEGLERKMQRLLAGAALHVDYEDGEGGAHGAAGKHQDVTTTRPHTRARSEDVSRFENFARQLLLTADGPLDRNVILERALEEGIRVGGENQANTVSARLFRMDGVVSKRGVGYWLQSREEEFFPPEGSGSTPATPPDVVE